MCSDPALTASVSSSSAKDVPIAFEPWMEDPPAPASKKKKKKAKAKEVQPTSSEGLEDPTDFFDLALQDEVSFLYMTECFA